MPTSNRHKYPLVAFYGQKEPACTAGWEDTRPQIKHVHHHKDMLWVNCYFCDAYSKYQT